MPGLSRSGTRLARSFAWENPVCAGPFLRSLRCAKPIRPVGRRASVPRSDAQLLVEVLA
jgi:hypothetical protein